MKTEKHTTIAGEVIEYPKPSGELARFLARVVDATNDPRKSEAQLVELIYGRENPLLDQTIFPARGAVTKATFANPVYHVMLDLLDQKRVQTGALDPAAAAGQFSVTVTEAAAQLEVSDSAVRQAIKAGHLAAVKRGSQHLIDPASIATYRDRVRRRGPQPEPALRVRMGNRKGASLRVKAAGLQLVSKEDLEGGGQLIEAVVPNFERVAVAFSGKKTNRMFVLEPGDEADFFDFADFRIEGRYRVVEKVNDPETASKRFRAFVAS